MVGAREYADLATALILKAYAIPMLSQPSFRFFHGECVACSIGELPPGHVSSHANVSPSSSLPGTTDNAMSAAPKKKVNKYYQKQNDLLERFRTDNEQIQVRGVGTGTARRRGRVCDLGCEVVTSGRIELQGKDLRVR
jgi:hypothetical protein